MSHVATPEFWHSYRRFPRRVQRTADKNFRLLIGDSRHPSLHFKNLREDLWSARVGLNYRALATIENGDFVWFWIWNHTDYDRIVG